MKTLAERLKSRRESKGLTMTGLDRLSGVGTGVVSKLESGGVNSTLRTTEALAKALECSPGWLAFGQTGKR